MDIYNHLFGSSGKGVLCIKPVRPLFHRASRGEPPPDPLSLWERARVREFFNRRTLVFALIQRRMPSIELHLVRACRMNHVFSLEVRSSKAEKTKPAARRGRKTTDLHSHACNETAGLPAARKAIRLFIQGGHTPCRQEVKKKRETILHHHFSVCGIEGNTGGRRRQGGLNRLKPLTGDESSPIHP